MRTARRAALPWLALAGATALSSPAGAEAPQSSPPSKQACAQAYGDGQHLRADGKLLAARQALVLCAQSCPQAVRPDCVQWLGEVARAVPSIAVHAQDESGVDLTDVRVSIDGEKVATALTGQPLEIDPGAHTLRFEHRGSAPIEQPLVAVAGQKLRSIEIHFTAAPSSPAAPGPPQAPAEPAAPIVFETPPSTPSRRIPLASWALAGAGAAALAVAGGLWASAKSDYDHLNATCSPRCDPSLADGGRTKVVVGDVVAVAGGVSLGAAVLWYVLRPARSGVPSGSTSVDALDVTISPRAAVVGARLAF